MHVTETRRLARRHIKHTGRGSTIFNDRLVDGRRSLKVWGWALPQYESFQLVLKDAGFSSEIVELNSQRGPRYRIHVSENIPVDPLDDFNYVGSKHHY